MLKIGYPVDAGEQSFIVLVNLIKNADSHYVMGGKTSGLRPNSGAEFVWDRVKDYVRRQYCFEFNALSPANISNLSPRNLCTRGSSDGLACALATSLNSSNFQKDGFIVLISGAFHYEHNSQGLKNLQIEKVTGKDINRAAQSLYNKWNAACENEALALVLREDDAHILYKKLRDQNTNVQTFKLNKKTFVNLVDNYQGNNSVPIISCKTQDLPLLQVSLKAVLSKKPKFSTRAFTLLLLLLLCLVITFITLTSYKQDKIDNNILVNRQDLTKTKGAKKDIREQYPSKTLTKAVATKDDAKKNIREQSPSKTVATKDDAKKNIREQSPSKTVATKDDAKKNIREQSPSEILTETLINQKDNNKTDSYATDTIAIKKKSLQRTKKTIQKNIKSFFEKLNEIWEWIPIGSTQDLTLQEKLSIQEKLLEKKIEKIEIMIFAKNFKGACKIETSVKYVKKYGDESYEKAYRAPEHYYHVAEFVEKEGLNNINIAVRVVLKNNQNIIFFNYYNGKDLEELNFACIIPQQWRVFIPKTSES